MRSNIVDGYNLPANSSFNSKTPSLADSGQVAVSLGMIGGDIDTIGLWLGRFGSGSVVWSDGAGSLISDCSLNNAGLAVFPLGFASPDGLYFYDDFDGSSGLLTNRPIGTSAWTGAEVNTLGIVAFIASLTPADNNQLEWGSGLFIAYGSLVFADGFESGDTIGWSVVAP